MLAAPGIAVTGVFTLIFSWNEFLFAYILTRKAASTVTVGVESFFTLQGILWGRSRPPPPSASCRC